MAYLSKVDDQFGWLLVHIEKAAFRYILSVVLKVHVLIFYKG